MKACNTVALVTMSLFISAFCSAGNSYSQIYNPHGVKILSPAREQVVPINIQNFMVEGVSTDNSTNNCDVSLLLNGITPYVKASSKGKNGSDDFSIWERIFNSNLHLNVGPNKLTARLLCSDDDNNQITKYHSVNFTGTNETKVVESEPTSSENETTSTPITKVLNSPSIRDDISPPDITGVFESESTSSDQVVRNITSGPVIIPPSGSQESYMPDSSPVNDSVIIPNATSSSESSDNSTSPSVMIPSSESYPSNQVSKEIIEQRESRGEENNDIPLIFPTPSPRVTSDDDRDDTVLPVQDLFPVIENKKTKIEEGSHNETVSVPSNVKIPDSSESNFTGSPSANTLTTPPENQSQTMDVSNFYGKGAVNSTSIRAMAGADQIVNEGMEVTLSGDSTSTNSTQLSYEWRQVGGDLKVSMGQKNAKQISFQAPAVDKDSKLTFKFIVFAAGTQISSDEVDITINDVPQNLENNESSDSQDGELSENYDRDDN
ncbi:MAG: hypothetical protein WBX01_00990 [Nitrososphaeraceae archaeon]